MVKFISVKITKNNNGLKSHKAIFKKDDGKTKTINFGANNATTFINGADEKTRANYIARHRVREDWTVPNNAGSLSRFIKWGDSKNINKNISAFKKKFNLK